MTVKLSLPDYCIELIKGLFSPQVSLGKKNSVKDVVRNSGTRAAFVKAVCYSGTAKIKLAIDDVFYNQEHRLLTGNRYSRHFFVNRSDKVNLVNIAHFLCFIFIIIYYHAQE